MELAILDWIQQFMKSPIMDMIMVFVSTLGDKGYIYYVILALLLINKKTRKVGIVMGIAMILNFVICNLGLKPLVARTRPYDINTVVEILVHKPSSYSFPSGHSAQAFCVASALLFTKFKYAKPMFIFACVVGFSRLYLYVHFLSDVLGGAAVGMLCGYLAYHIFIYMQSKKEA